MMRLEHTIAKQIAVATSWYQYIEIFFTILVEFSALFLYLQLFVIITIVIHLYTIPVNE